VGGKYSSNNKNNKKEVKAEKQKQAAKEAKGNHRARIHVYGGWGQSSKRQPCVSTTPSERV